MSPESEKYNRRGVSAAKEDVHKAIRRLDKGLYPNAFCKILPDIVGGDQEACNIMHADTAGTKTSIAYLYWRETGDASVWRGIAQDALVMNTDDMACVGCVDNIVISSTIARNKHLIPGEVIEQLIDGTVEFMDMMSSHGISLRHAGGETADTGDIVRTIDVGFTAFARMARSNVINNQIKPGAVILGLASDGRATYETAYNSGIGCNGLTSARHDLLHHDYARMYPESFSPQTDEAYVYTGPWRVTDPVEIGGIRTDIGKLLLSPTRTYLPMLIPIIREYRKGIQGIIHCTGGGFSKVLKFLASPVTIEIEQVPEPPVVFQLIRQASGTSLAEMYKVFNMGIRMMLFVDAQAAEAICDLLNPFGVKVHILGEVRRATQDALVNIHTGDPVEPRIIYQ
jgi:phosphoribosylformylglycinamidine cyclo-ligase